MYLSVSVGSILSVKSSLGQKENWWHLNTRRMVWIIFVRVICNDFSTLFQLRGLRSEKPHMTGCVICCWCFCLWDSLYTCYLKSLCPILTQASDVICWSQAQRAVKQRITFMSIQQVFIDVWPLWNPFLLGNPTPSQSIRSICSYFMNRLNRLFHNN